MFNIEFKNNSEGLEIFESISNKLNDKSLLHRNIGIYLLKKTRERFEKSIDVYDQPFAPIRQREDGSSVPLVDTGQLKNSIMYTYTKDKVEIGTPLFYASMHNDGDEVYQRQYLPKNELSNSYISDINDLIMQYLTVA